MTATRNVSYIRQTSILDPEKAATTHITIAGCGTVGSNAAVQLARAGFKQFHLVDMDVVEPHNMPSQCFELGAIGMNKALATDNEMSAISEELQVTYSEDPLEGGEIFKSGVVICAVDSMQMREKIFKYSAAANPQIKLFIDFRMGGNMLQAWAFDPQDRDYTAKYLKTLYADGEVADLPCGGQTFAPVGALSGAIATQLVTKYLREGDAPPFYLYFDFDNFVVRTAGRKPVSETV